LKNLFPKNTTIHSIKSNRYLFTIPKDISWNIFIAVPEIIIMKGNVAGGLPTFQRLATLNPKAKTKSRASFSNTGTLFISANVGCVTNE